jgi:hypothetical protein
MEKKMKAGVLFDLEKHYMERHCNNGGNENDCRWSIVN